MFFSYAMGLPLLLHLNVFIDSKKNLYLFVAIYEFILILLFGSRGIILAIILFILFKFIEADLSPLKKILYSFIGIVLLLAFSINFNKIGQGIISFLDSKGLYSRTLTLFFRDNNLLHLSDRDYIWKKEPVTLEVEDSGILFDVDTMDDYYKTAPFWQKSE